MSSFTHVTGKFFVMSEVLACCDAMYTFWRCSQSVLIFGIGLEPVVKLGAAYVKVYSCIAIGSQYMEILQLR